MAITTEIRLKSEIIGNIKRSLECKNRLQFELGISYLTLQRWLNGNSEKLTTAHALNIISEVLNIPKDDLLNG